MSLIKIRDQISPDLLRRARAASNRRPMLQAMGMAVRTLGIQAFSDSSKRPTPWASRLGKETHPLLQMSTMLRKSIRITELTDKRVTVGSDRPYALTHQFGRDQIPARPYLPFNKEGQITPLGKQQVERALVAALRSRGL